MMQRAKSTGHSKIKNENHETLAEPGDKPGVLPSPDHLSLSPPRAVRFALSPRERDSRPIPNASKNGLQPLCPLPVLSSLRSRRIEGPPAPCLLRRVLISLLLLTCSLLLNSGVSALERTDWPIVFPAFRNDTGDTKWDWLSAGLPETIRTKLHGTIYMRAFTWEEINQVVSKEPGLFGNTVEISRRLGSNLLVLGSYKVTGETIEIIGQCIDPQSGRQLNTFKSMGSTFEPAVALNGLLMQIAQALRIDLPPEHIESIRRPATGIVDAFREHAEGLIALNREDGTRAGNMVDAKAHFQNAISLDPDYADPHYRLATLLQHEKDVSGAEKSYREALRADVDHRDARYRLGLLLIDEDRKSEAMSELEQALKQSPEDPRMQTALSSIWFDQYQSNFQQMADQIKQAIANSPDDAQLYVELGSVYEELSQVNEAIAEYRLALEKDPSHAEAAYKLGMVERNIGNVGPSTKLLKQAIRNGTEQKRVHFYLGEMLALQNDHKGATEAFAKAVETEPSHAEAYFELGTAYAATGNHQDALLAFHKYSQINKRDARPHLQIGKAYAAMGLPKQALSSFEQSVKVDPKFAEGHIAIGELYEQEKLTIRAGKAFKEALRLEPDHPRAEELKDLIRKYQPAQSGKTP